MAKEIDYADLIGKPFKYGGRGPETYDCYGLITEMLRREGKGAPDYKSPSKGPEIVAMVTEKRQFWKETEMKPGAIIVIRLLSNMHVGYLLPYGRFIHTWEKSGGVVVEHLREWKRRIVGCYEYE